ncbi:MAG: ABC transporter permease [Anaerolineales bacterium]|nr:ABC transporter permease [Anaerolineales bacterium]
MRYLLSTTKGRIGLLFVSIVIFMAIGAEYISPYSPTTSNLRLRLEAPGSTDAEGHTYYLGTDQLGRDFLTRIIYGARISVIVSISAVFVSGSIGLVLGTVAGYIGSWLDSLIMRMVDIQLSVPMIILAIVWVAFFGPGILGIVIVIGVWGWVQYARLSRGMTLSLKETEFIQAAQIIGAPTFRIIFKHIVPNLIGPIIVMATLQLGHAVLIEASLSFLGVGVPPPTPTWGGMLADGRSYIDTAWWTAVFPGMGITLFVLGANLLGDTLRDALDPRISQQMRQ